MQTVYDSQTLQDLVQRLKKLSPSSKPLWGKMSVDQMLHHLNRAMEVPLGKRTVQGKPKFFMRPFRAVLYNDKPFGKGTPTPREFKIQESYDFAQELGKAIQNLKEVSERAPSGSFLPHVFFGYLTTEQWGKHFYKHTDHHLRQFGL